MTDSKSKTIFLVIGFILGCASTGTIAWNRWRPRTFLEPAAPAVRQEDGSLEAERIPAKPSDVKPPHLIPSGSKLERTGNVSLHVFDVEKAPTFGCVPQGEGVNLPVIRIDWSQVKTPDGGHRMIFSSPDGRILDAKDYVVAPSKDIRELKWAAGIILGRSANGGHLEGAFIDRDFAFVRTGMEVARNTYRMLDCEKKEWSVNVKIGGRF